MSKVIADHTTRVVITKDVGYAIARCSRSRCGRTDIPSHEEMELHITRDWYGDPPVMEPFEHFWPVCWTVLVANYRYEGEKKAFCPDCRPK